MQRVHLVYGIILIILFLLSGYVMLNSFPVIYGDSPEIRMMFRANHIYILFAALLNLSISLIQSPKEIRPQKIAEWISSILILAGGILLVIAFVIEPAASTWDRPITFSGIIFHLTGISVLAMLQIFRNREPETENEN